MYLFMCIYIYIYIAVISARLTQYPIIKMFVAGTPLINGGMWKRLKVSIHTDHIRVKLQACTTPLTSTHMQSDSFPSQRQLDPSLCSLALFRGLCLHRHGTRLVDTRRIGGKDLKQHQKTIALQGTYSF